MVAAIVRLKLRILANGLRRSPWQVIALCLAAVYGLFLVFLAASGIAWLSTQDVEGLRVGLQLIGAVVVLGWWIVPLVAFGVDATMDPAMLATYPIPTRRLIVGLGLSGLVGVPGVMTVLLFLATVAAWWRHPGGLVPALGGAVLAVAMCVVGSRALTTALAPVITGRRFRELTVALMIIPLVLLGPIITTIGTGVRLNENALPSIAEAVAWTPFAAPLALAGDVVEGRYAAAAGRLAICLVSIAVLGWLWERTLAKALVNVRTSAPSKTRSSGIGLIGRLPGTPVGAIAARGLIYWFRDPRYALNLVVVPLMPAVLYFASQAARGDGGSSQIMLVSGPLCAFLVGWISASAVSYDGTALWMHVGAPITGRQERWGRAVPGLAVGLPTAVLVTGVSCALENAWGALLPLLGISLAVLGGAIGISMVLSAYTAWPTQKAGENPFTTPQGATMAAFAGQMIGWLVLMVLAAVPVAVGVRAIVLGTAAWAVGALLLGTVAGLAALIAGVRIGGRVWDRRAPELLHQLASFK